MTVEEWLVCDSPSKMLRHLLGSWWWKRPLVWFGLGKPIMGFRKVRLYSCAVCRQNANYVRGDSRCKHALEISEAFADGAVTGVELSKSNHVARDIVQEGEWWGGTCTGDLLLADATHCDEIAGILGILDLLRTDTNEEIKQQADLFREIYGRLPFGSVTINPSWLTAHVVKLAQQIYGDGTFDRMPELANGLEEAGCDNVEILAHCRGSGPHVRGCWALDLVLGKS
jgi:hypothetical protein